jgi:single-stranded-DNA-specific exonuclease
VKPVIAMRPVPLRSEENLRREGLHPVLARLAAARGIDARSELDDALGSLLSPALLLGMDKAAQRLADAIEHRERVLIVADYDCDGATACAVGLRALRTLRFQDGRAADVRYLVPDRFRYGYGLTPEIVQLAATQQPRVIVTVDNGIASTDGVAAANALGIEVIVTDHHLPGAQLPAAAAIVNPNQPGCAFPSKAIAGVGVMFYLMLSLRAELRKRGAFGTDSEPNLADLLDLVALGTVADVVPLDRNNRVLVGQGLKRMRTGRLQPGLRALFAVAGRDPRRAACFDLGFLLGPRINAAGRLTDMSLGIECLVTEDYGRALEIARSLDDLNRERRVIEGGMREQAERMLEGLDVGESCALSLYDPSWHQGVVGILAGRVKERWHRPTIAFARSSADNADNELKGSGRSIPGLHLRDALDLVAKREPGLLLRFGGHAAAAGLTLKERDYERFAKAFEQAVHDMLPADALDRRLDTDGSLEPSYLDLGMARMLEEQIWGQGFPQPLFCDEFSVVSQRIVGAAHLKLKLIRAERMLEAMLFNSLEQLPAVVRAVYRVSVNEFNGAQMLQLVIEHWEPAVQAPPWKRA